MKNNNELVLSPGDTLQLQFYPAKTHSEREERFYVRLIGYLPGKSLIATAPTSDGHLLSLRESSQFTVRLISGNSVQAFISTLIATSSRPYHYIHLSYPEIVESKMIRQAQRVNTNVIASIQNQEPGKEEIKTKSAVLSDLSSAGALILSNEELGTVGDIISLTMKLNVANKEEYLTVTAIIRRSLGRTSNGDSKSRCGVEFQIGDEKEKLLIHAYVYEQLAKAAK